MAQKKNATTSSTSMKETNVFENQSSVLMTSSILKPDELQSIHEENVSRLQSMTAEEILTMREQLMKDLKPDTINFLTKKDKKISQEPMETDSVSINEKTERKVTKTKANDDINDITLESKKAKSSDDDQDISFLHMDKPELDKMEWTSDLPLSTYVELPNAGFSARFNFEGQLLPYGDENIPVSSGLHHHGEEQERPGYTIDELMTLARSTNVPQRTMALNTIAKIIQKFKTGGYDEVFEQNLLQEMLDNGVVTVSRVCMDEKTENLREAALFCLRQVIDNQYDEYLLDFSHSNSSIGHIQPSLPTSVISDRDERLEFAQSKEQLKDHEVMKLDVILGLLRTEVLQRLAYILTNLNQSESAVANSLHITIRIARHSLQSASEVLNQTSLMQCVYKILLHEKSDGKIVYSALKLMRVISAWSQSFARILLEKSSLSSLLPKFLSKEFGRIDVATESLRVWDTFLQYGLLTDLYLDLFPIVTKNLLVVNGQVDVMSENQAEMSNFEIICMFLKVLESVFNCQRHDVNGLEWRQVKDVFNLLENIVKNLLRTDFNKLGELESRQKQKLLSTCLRTFESALICYGKAEDVITVVEKVANLFENFLGPFIESELMMDCIEKCLNFSGLLELQKICQDRDPKNLPSLKSFAFRGELAFSASEKSPFNLLASVSKLLLRFLNLHKNLPKFKLQNLLENKKLLRYLQKIPNFGSANLGAWFLTNEIDFLVNILFLNDHGQGLVLDLKLRHKLAHSLIPLIQERNKNALSGLMAKLLETFDDHEIVEKLGSLRFGDEKSHLKQVLEMNEMREIYKKYLPMNKTGLENPEFIQTLTVKNSGEALLPKDWVFLPLLHIFNQSESQGSKFELSEENQKDILACLRMVCLDIMNRTFLETGQFELIFSRLITVFLVSPSLFFEEEISQMLKACLQEMLLKIDQENVPDFENKIPGIESFRDLYLRLIEQYSSVSYGNSLFGLMVILPTAFSSKLRSSLWLDNLENLRGFLLNEDSLPNNFGIQKFNLDSADPELLNAYAKAVISKTLDSKRTPLLFKIAALNLKSALTSNCEKCVKIVQKFQTQAKTMRISLE